MKRACIFLTVTAVLATDGIMANEADFRSAWKSASGKDEWITVDLGATANGEPFELEELEVWGYGEEQKLTGGTWRADGRPSVLLRKHI